MAAGILRIQSYAARQSAPVAGVTVTVTGSDWTASRITDETGSAADVEIETPASGYSLDESNTTVLPYATCDLAASKPGYHTVRIEGVQIFDGQVTLAPLEMIPNTARVSPAADETVVIPVHALFAGAGGSGPAPGEDCAGAAPAPAILPEVVIPSRITVHLGAPAASASNVTVSFRDYIANVASSEVYPTWPEQALRANIHAQISLTLNRIYTEWYPSRGYSFNITNSISYDQSYVHGRTVFAVMVDLVDDIFNSYIRKTGTVNPYFAAYCDGKSISCAGLKQWGTVTLAEQGRSALSILRYYYGSDIEVVRTNNISAIPESYPGSPIRQGDRGANVFLLQRQLNRIAKDYPYFGSLTVDGIFGSQMAATVRRFQSQFGLTADGVVGRQTWYKISYIYVSVKDLAELTSEGETASGILSDGAWGGVTLRTGSRGAAVEQLQFWLSTISQYVSSIPSVSVDGVFGSGTAAAVRAFQRRYGLTVDGVVGEATWNAVYNQFFSIQSDNGTPNAYPGVALREGDIGQNVRLVQFWLKIARTVYTGLNDPAVDGVFGSGTRRAVEVFQRYFGLSDDGVVGRTTWNKLHEVYTDVANDLLSANLRPGEFPGALRRGSTGRAVRELQYYLYLMSAYDSSLPSVSIDGSFGAATERAVRAYQQLAGLTVDGVVGETTWASLYAQANRLRASGPVVTVNRMDYPGAPLEVGAEGDAVLYYSVLLARIAYYFDTVGAPGPAAYYSDAMANGTASLQELLELPVTGNVDAATWAAAEALSLSLLTGALSPNAPVAAGDAYPGRAAGYDSAGQSVGTIQRWLNRIAAQDCGAAFVEESSLFGREEEALIRALQQKEGLDVNGSVDRQTWAALARAAGEEVDPWPAC